MRVRRLAVAAGLAALAAVVIVAAVWGLQRRLIYFPSGGPVVPAARAVDGARDVTLMTADGLRLGAWYASAPGRSGVTVLVANGNAGNRAARAPLAIALVERSIGVLLFDYRGYGGNPGSPNEAGLALDVRAARDFLVGTAGVPPGRLLYYGESLGAAVVAELATEHPPAGLLLRSPFTSLADVGRVHYPWLPLRSLRSLLRDRFTVAEHVARLDVPVTVLYGSADTIVPPEQSRAVATAARGRVRLVEVPGAGHNDLSLLAGEELLDAVADLARSAGG